ncbi:MAG TPA: NADPH-dependent FMN reductase [Thermomicrobiales bacterium]|nr:NADPH-dependent FMN reductase [Thermomicrobiales bacterium]
MTHPFPHDPSHEVEPSPAETPAREVIHNRPDPAMYADDNGVEGPTIYTGDTARPVRILGIGGTTSPKSWSLVPLEAALNRARERGCEVVEATVYELDLPLFRTDWRLEDYPQSLSWLLDEVRRADGLIICSPTYHGTLSGAIKNVLDTLIFLGWDQPPYLGGKPVGIMAYGGMTAMGVLQALTSCVRGLKGITIPTHVAVPEKAVDRELVAITDERLNDRIDLMIDELISFSARLRVPHKAPRVRKQQAV